MYRHDIKPNSFMFGLHNESLGKLNASLQLQLNRLNEIGCGLIIDNVKGLIELSKSLGLECIAPCIEDPHTHHLLLDMGCHLLQGNLIVPPSPPTSITRMLIERNSVPKQEVWSS